MNESRRRPSRFVAWLLAAVSSRSAADAVVGDILEDLDERRIAGRAPRVIGLWLNWQLLRFVVAAAATSARRTLHSSFHTVRDAARALRRSPGHSLFIVAILSVGLSAATTMFSVVDTVLFKPFPFDHSEDIVRLAGRNARGATGVTSAEFWAVHDRVPGLESMSSVAVYLGAVSAGGVTENMSTLVAMSDLFRVLRLEPFVGRLWTAEDERRGDTQVVVLSYAFWQRRFGGDPGVIGQSMQLDAFRVKSHRIIGVLPPKAVYPTLGSPVDLWAPGEPERTSPSVARFTSAIGRVRSGVTMPQVLAQVQSVVAAMPNSSGASSDHWRPEVTRWDQQPIDADVRLWLLLLLGIVALIVLIACFNAANVMLTRSAQRARELAVRASLGASRRHLVASLAAESLMLSTAASLCGLAFASWGVHVVRATMPVALFRSGEISVDGRVFVAAAIAAVVTGLLFGIVPAWQASRVSVVTLLKDGASTLTGVRRRWRSIFLVSEIACIGVLLVVSTLFITSFVRVTSIDLGFDRSNLIGISTVTDYQGTVEDVRRQFAEIPGVTAVAAVGTTSLPLVASFGGAYVDSPLLPTTGPADVSVDVEIYRVTPNYFEIMGIPFRRGSTWSASAAPDFEPIVVEEQAARRLFGDRDPLGQQVRASELDGRVFTIVGTVAPVLPHGPEQTNEKAAYYGRPTAYYAMDTSKKRGWVSFLLRTGPPADTVVRAVESVYASIAPPNTSAGAGVRLFDDGYRNLTANRRFNANLMSAFAIFAMIIGAAGIYAVMASVVAQQTREIGVRVALGATARDIRRGVLGMAGRHVLIGLALGLPVAWWISRGFSALLFHVRPTDPSTYLIVAAVLGVVSLIGAVVPARRASRVDPVVSLRAS